MPLSKARRAAVKAKVTWSVLLLFYLLSACAGPAQGMSVDEILTTEVRVPVHHLDLGENSWYGQLKASYQYSDPSEVYLVTRFSAEDLEGRRAQVAELVTCWLCTPPIRTDPDQPTSRRDASVAVSWALDGYTGVCDWVADPFQSCVYWFGTSGERLIVYKLETVWPEEETVEFANSLSVLKTAD
jgi:hypothetical protein